MSTDFQRAPGTPDLPATPFRFICYFVVRYRWWYLAMLTMETLNAACGISIPYALSRIIKSVTGAHEQSMALVTSLQGPLLLFVALSAGEVLFGRLAGAIQIRLGPRQRQNVTRTIYHYLQHHSHRYFSNNFAGALAHRISETSMGVTQTLWSVITEFWPVVIVFSVAITLLYTAHPQLAAFVGTWAVLFIGISYLLARRAQPHAFRASSARSETTGKVVDSVTNLTSARLFARLKFERDFLEDSLQKELVMVRRSNSYSERVRWFQFAAAAVLKVGTLYFALTLWGQGKIGVAEFVMAVSLSLLIINEARNLSRRFLEFFEFIGNVANGVHTIVRPHELVDQPGAAPARISTGRIEFRDVDFSYGGERKVFNKLNLTIPAGQRVGLVGFSGSGKSTFVSVILRLYDVQGGQIVIDGTDIRQMTQDALHGQLSLIPQDPSLFHRTLKENIRYGRLDASDEEVVEAAKKAYAHDFIVDMKEQYDSMVGERGIKVSGGQRQRIAIARVILKDAPILILDEATSALDSITEKAIQNTLDEVMKGKTVLVVAHRLSTIAHLDRILVFDNGEIIEDGSHAELIARQGAYYRLWSKQSDGFLPESSNGEAAPARRLEQVPAGSQLDKVLPDADSSNDPDRAKREDPDVSFAAAK
ncbi:putative multidrug export ATP-binding/permease protein [Andreprevotia sp. IGB-42]|uniref:ABC transporter ATP-binding protein n=1 Tax=Andreprevotia sp. IGB-42 TaxID=2497473 RepID=UPI00157E993D|nr:ABC transporter ATP-binding protein [Andreprevotia sp. IGB-42]KAF0815119.1 putative multidrug export ATP-binding/permease protein [Andreprevotia sp. IGB-42]